MLGMAVVMAVHLSVDAISSTHFAGDEEAFVI